MAASGKKVVLINPPWEKAKGSLWGKVGSCMPPLGLAYLAAVLEKNSVETFILDLEAEPAAFEAVPAIIRQKIGTPDYVGITATTNLIDHGYEIAAECKKAFPEAKTVFGGVHPTILPEEAFIKGKADFVVRGEGEYTLLDLVSGKDPRGIQGLSYSENGRIIHNPERPLVEVLDELPFPAYHKLPMKKYRASVAAYKRSPVISMLASRGCPGRCTYCFGFFLGKKFRMHSPRYLADGIKMLKKEFGIREITFYDDTFTVFKNNVREFCRILVDEKIDITWTCFSRVDFVDAETLSKMKKAGCHQICFGLESGNEDIIKSIKKGTSLLKAKEAVKMTKEAGIEARAAFMLGVPGETEATIKQTMDFAVDIDPDIVVFNITTPYPGTEMYDWAVKNGYLKINKWSDLDWARPSMDLPTISKETISKYYAVSQKRFFSRPKYIIKRLLKIRTLGDLIMTLKAAFVVWFKK